MQKKRTASVFGHFFLESEPIFSDLAGLLTCSSPLSLPINLWRFTVAICLIGSLLNLQQRDCSGLAPDSLLMPFQATKSGAKLQFFYEIQLFLQKEFYWRSNFMGRQY